jgi:hypothetical protein
MEKPSFTRVCLSRVRAIMATMCVPVVELLCYTVMGWLPVIKHLM